MRLIPIFLLILCVALSLNAKKLEVLTTFTIIDDMAKNVAGEAANVRCLAKFGADIHSYEATPKDIIKAKKSDIILYNGLNLELWIAKYLQNVSKPSFNLTDDIEPILIANGTYKGKPNPHAWMSLKNAQIYVRNIQNALSQSDPQNAWIYAKNADDYIAKLAKIEAKFRSKFEAIPKEKRYLVSSESAFSYLASEYGFKELYIWSVNSDEQGTTKQIKNLIDRVVNNKASVIFSESTISKKPAMTVANETGIRYGGVLYVDSLDAKVKTYIDLIDTTYTNIINGYSDEKN
ncbi:putative Mn2+/Fe2+ ABC transporter, periplasmic substrate-binding protein [Campylobacter iguaniorum]|uniref:Putative Mn2+/Fe2+ ABC transporter, periplasmic substrate-binding protein n=1 Tax=Campylobacter iguaniorum TaxID=1244531 RepID=A0A076FFI9_9BACT|nr:zinc ABC transporter substrate-binding protein [Campylobacter iguaniorum]AII14619.1 putative Mn2+/Fe2+ ABC transporter, periplasmic substrate-binding protein [Campylobacter iguaniorum]